RGELGEQARRLTAACLEGRDRLPAALQLDLPPAEPLQRRRRSSENRLLFFDPCEAAGGDMLRQPESAVAAEQAPRPGHDDDAGRDAGATHLRRAPRFVGRKEIDVDHDECTGRSASPAATARTGASRSSWLRSTRLPTSTRRKGVAIVTAQPSRDS